MSCKACPVQLPEPLSQTNPFPLTFSCPGHFSYRVIVRTALLLVFTNKTNAVFYLISGNSCWDSSECGDLWELKFYSVSFTNQYMTGYKLKYSIQWFEWTLYGVEISSGIAFFHVVCLSVFPAGPTCLLTLGPLFAMASQCDMHQFDVLATAQG